jgi:DNA-binding transcriptional LysR family regulator
VNDSFSGIREFVATVDSGSLTAAAVLLGVTGSAVGKSISRLEARLGVQLLHRTTRRMDLTTEGEAYLVSCRRVLEELAQTESLLSTGHQQPIGRLRISSEESLQTTRRAASSATCGTCATISSTGRWT